MQSITLFSKEAVPGEHKSMDLLPQNISLSDVINLSILVSVSVSAHAARQIPVRDK